jgi:hypothetical protein
MKTTFEIQKAISPLDKKVVIERLHNMRNIWNVNVDLKNRLISFEYLNRNFLEVLRRELGEMGLHVINDTHQLDNITKP